MRETDKKGCLCEYALAYLILFLGCVCILLPMILVGNVIINVWEILFFRHFVRFCTARERWTPEVVRAFNEGPKPDNQLTNQATETPSEEDTPLTKQV